MSLLLIILLLAMPVRLYLARSAEMISRDGVTFLWYAQHLAHDPGGEMRKQAQHPLYPGLVLAAHSTLQAAGSVFRPASASLSALLDDPIRSWTLAGMGVTLLGGLAVVWAVYVLTSLLFDRRAGLVAAVLAALAAEFCQLSADALTDMPHLAFYLFGICAAIRALRPDLGAQGHERAGEGKSEAGCPASSEIGGMKPRRPALIRRRRVMLWLFLSGLLSGLAYLMRPEGAGVAVATVAGVMLLAGQGQFRRRLAGALTVIVGAALVASPYMLTTGKLVQKKSIFRLLMPGSCETAEPDLALAPVPPLGERFRETVRREGRPAEKAGDTEGRAAGVAPHDAGTIPGDLARAVALVVEHWGRALRVTLILPAVAWLFLRKQAPANGVASRLVILVASLHFTLLVGLILQFDYADMLSVRHAMILAGLTLPFSGAGIAAVLAGLPERKRVLAGVFIVTGLVAPTLPWMLERRYAHEAYLRRAGEWIRARQPTGARVHTTRHPVAFYANGVHQWSPLDVDIVRILAEARSHHPDWLVFDLQRLLKMSPSFVADLERAARPGELERAHDMKQEVRGRLQTARIYRYHPPS